MSTYVNAKLASPEKSVRFPSALARLWPKERALVMVRALAQINANASMAGTEMTVPNRTVSRRVAMEALVSRRIHVNARKGTVEIAANLPSVTASL